MADQNLPGYQPRKFIETGYVKDLSFQHRKDGNLGDISKAGSLHEFLMVLHKDFGPIASFWWGKRYTVSIASAELFQEVAHIFDRPEEPYANFKPLMEPKCIEFANKEEGQKRREHYMKALTEEAMKRNFPQLQQVANQLVEKWSELAGQESKIPMTQHASLFALKSLIHSLFGNLMKDDSQEELDFRTEADEVWGEIEISLVQPRTKDRDEHMKEGKKDLSDLVKHLINDRKSNPPPSEAEETFLDRIITYTEDLEVQHADVLEFTTAGQYTTEYLLVCALYFVVTHPEVEGKLYDEIKSVLGDKDVDGSSVDQLVYLRQVLDETLRCAIDVPWGARVQDVDVTLGGYHIPKKTPVITALGVALTNESAWPQPDIFDPERFSRENTQKRPKLWFSPFGVGRRECLAKTFPYAAATVFMVSILRQFKVHLVEKAQALSLVYGLITHQKEEIYITLTPR